MNIQTTQTQTTQPQPTTVEEIPTQWLDERDDAFFRITATLFPAEFTFGAGVLLASYDDENDTDGE